MTFPRDIFHAYCVILNDILLLILSSYIIVKVFRIIGILLGPSISTYFQTRKDPFITISVKAPSSDRKGPVPVKLEGQENNSTHRYTYEDTKLSVSKVELCIDRAFLKEVVIIHGTGFLEGMSVMFDRDSATGIDVVSDRKLRVRAPIAPASWVIDLELRIPGETQSVITRLEYPRSVIDSITPSSGAVYGGDWIDVRGRDFVRGQVVMFGNECALETDFVSANNLCALVPAALQPGPVPIRLMGQAVSPCQYTYLTGSPSSPSDKGFRDGEEADSTHFGRNIAALNVPHEPVIPRITMIYPTSDNPAWGETISVLGEGFNASHEVLIGGKVATVVKFISETALLVRVPPSDDPGPAPVALKGHEHTAGGDPPQYNYAIGKTSCDADNQLWKCSII